MQQQTSLKEHYAAFRSQRRRNLILIAVAAAIPTLLAALCGRLEIVICILFFALPIGACIFAVFSSKALKQLTSRINEIRTPHLLAALQEHYADVHQLDEEAVRRNAQEAAALYRKSIEVVMSHPALGGSGKA